VGGASDLTSIEEVFKQMAQSHLPFAGLSLSKIGDLGVPLALVAAATPALEVVK